MKSGVVNHSLFSTVLTYWISDDKRVWCLNKWPHANAVFSCNSEKVGFSLNKTLYSSVLSSDCVGHRGPCFAVSFPLLNDIVGDGGAAVIFWREPCELAGVIG